MTSGKVIVDGRDISLYNSRQLTKYRRDDIGFVFQFYNLIQNLNALENVELALQISKHPMDAKDAEGRGHWKTVCIISPHSSQG